MRKFPQELIDNIVDQCNDDDLHTCALVANTWTSRAQTRQFETLDRLDIKDLRKLLELFARNLRIAAYVKNIQLHLTLTDPRQDMADTVSTFLEKLICLARLEFSVFPCPLTGSHESSHSYVFPLELRPCIQNTLQRPELVHLTLVNWQFDNIHSLFGTIAPSIQLKDLTLSCCHVDDSEISSDDIAPSLPVTLKSIELLELMQCTLTTKFLQWIATSQISLNTLQLSGLEAQNLYCLEGNRLGLSVQNICLVIDLSEYEEDDFQLPRLGELAMFPTVTLKVDLGRSQIVRNVIIVHLEQALSSILHPSQSTLHMEISTDSNEDSSFWEALDKLVASASVTVQSRYLHLEDSDGGCLQYTLSLD
ncbi:hypothetical protein C8R43DRAFT_1051854, partial [Mycena crocata]